MAAQRAKFEVFKARNKQWSWRLRGRNGRIMAVSGETLTRRADARRAALRVHDVLFLKSVDIHVDY